MKLVLVGVAALIMLGCSKPPADQPDPNVVQGQAATTGTQTPVGTQQGAGQAAPGTGGDGIAMGPPNAGITPVMPQGDLQGAGGGGAGQAAKDKARSVANGMNNNAKGGDVQGMPSDTGG